MLTQVISYTPVDASYFLHPLTRTYTLPTQELHLPALLTPRSISPDLVFPPNHSPALVTLHSVFRPDPIFPPNPKPQPPGTFTIPPGTFTIPPPSLQTFPAKSSRQNFQVPYKLSILHQSITNLLSLQSSPHLSHATSANRQPTWPTRPIHNSNKRSRSHTSKHRLPNASYCYPNTPI